MIDSTLLTPLGRLIRGARLRMDLTLEEVSNQLGITRERFSEYELGKRVPRPRRSIAIAHFLGIPVDEFLQKRGQS